MLLYWKEFLGISLFYICIYCWVIFWYEDILRGVSSKVVNRKNIVMAVEVTIIGISLIGMAVSLAERKIPEQDSTMLLTYLSVGFLVLLGAMGISIKNLKREEGIIEVISVDDADLMIDSSETKSQGNKESEKLTQGFGAKIIIRDKLVSALSVRLLNKSEVLALGLTYKDEYDEYPVSFYLLRYALIDESYGDQSKLITKMLNFSIDVLLELESEETIGRVCLVLQSYQEYEEFYSFKRFTTEDLVSGKVFYKFIK